MAQSAVKRFRAVLESLGGNLGWVVARLPFDVETTWKKMVRLRVKVEVGGEIFRTSLFADSQGRGHFVLVNKKMQKAAGAGRGAMVDLAIEPDLEERTPTVPPELATLLKTEKRLGKWYVGLSEPTRWEIAKWIDGVKSVEARQRRAEQIAERLMLTMEGEKELPPVLEVAFRRTPAALKGWETMTKGQRRSNLMAVFYYQSPEARGEAGAEAGGGLFEGGTQVRRRILALGLTVISRSLLLRDRMNGRMGEILGAFSCDSGRLVISSGHRELSAVYVEADGKAPTFLICHGIGERVEYWGGVQLLLQRLGISSLVFNYSGYGASSGNVSAAHCEEDAMAAYRELVVRGCQSIFLVGFSLGSGVVSAVASKLKVDGVILCEGYSTLREAAVAIGLPQWIARIVPNVWETMDRARELEVPVLVMHSDEDRMFPLSMARRVAEACGRRGELIVVHGVSHDSPIFAPTESYWGPVADWAKRVWLGMEGKCRDSE